jgi:hypothetical protein
VRWVFYFLKRWREKIEILFWVGEAEGLLQVLALALACATCKCA